MKHHLLGTGTKILAEASPLDQVWGSGLRADDPDAHDPYDPHSLQALSTVCDLLSHDMDGLAHPSSSPQLCTPIQFEGIH